MSSPRFSVVICTYNRAELLCRSVASVLNQTVGDFEVQVVDDGSSDNTRLVMEAMDDSRVHYLRRPKNGGIAAARNDGLRAAKGELVVFLDDDDEFRPHFIERMGSHFDACPELAFSWCGAEVRSRNGEWRKRVAFPSNDDRLSKTRAALAIGTGLGLTLRRECFQSVGEFDEELRAGEDLDFVIRLTQFKWDWAPVEELLVVLHEPSGARLTRNSVNRLMDLDYVYKKHYDYLASIPDFDGFHSVLDRFSVRLANSAYEISERGLARSSCWRAIRRHPLDWRLWSFFIANEVFGHSSPGIRRRIVEAYRRLFPTRHKGES